MPSVSHLPELLLVEAAAVLSAGAYGLVTHLRSAAIRCVRCVDSFPLSMPQSAAFFQLSGQGKSGCCGFQPALRSSTSPLA